MRFSCESCGAQYMISDEKVGPGGVKVRCKKCGNVIPVRRAGSAEATAAPQDASTPVESAAMAGTPPPDAAQSEGSLLGAAPVDPAARAEITSEWYVAIDDRQVGPIPTSAVRTRWDAGEIGPDTLAWRSGMADWSPLAAIPELARQLSSSAAQPQEGTPQRSATASNGVAAGGLAEVAVHGGASHGIATSGVAMNGMVNGAVNGAVNGKLNGHDASWQPGAGNALAALASNELNALEKSPAVSTGVSTAPAEPARTGPSLLDTMNLPEGGVDPTHLVPLPMKGVERTTEVVLKPKAPVSEHEPTQIRQLRKSAKRSGVAWGLGIAAAAAILVVGVFWFMHGTSTERSSAGTLAQAPAPATVEKPSPAPVAPAPEPAPAPPAASAAAAPVAATPPPAPPVQAAPPAAEPPPERAPEPVAAAAAQHPVERPAATRKQVARAEAPTPKAKPAPRVAAADRTSARAAPANAAPNPAAPAAAPVKRKPAGDPLLDVGGDDELEKELASNKPKRNVYVPPAIGSDVPDSVSVSQINEAVVGQKAALLRCIEEQRAVDPNARGTLKMRWIISADGSTRDVRNTSDEFAKQPIAPCISNVVKGIRFPRSRTSGQEVVFPFKF